MQLSGFTLALMLIPQSMAYAELAGLLSYYESLCFIQYRLSLLHSGALTTDSFQPNGHDCHCPSVLMPFAGLQEEDYNKYTTMEIVLALCVGVVRLLIGAFKMVMIHFISHPVSS